MARFGKIEIPDKDVARLSSSGIADVLIAAGVTRLTAHRMVAIEQGKTEPGRAPPHAKARH